MRMFEIPTEEIAMERNTHRETHAYTKMLTNRQRGCQREGERERYPFNALSSTIVVPFYFVYLL